MAAPTSITDLGDDMLRQIFLRLPALPSLVRAASACRAFRRAVRSSPAFRRSFRALHGPPLLAIFKDTFLEAVPAFPSPPPWRHPDKNLFALSFFYMYRLPVPGACPGWEKMDARFSTEFGYIALVNACTTQKAIYNPLTQSLKIYPRPPRPGQSVLDGTQLEFHALIGEDGQRSSRVVCVRRSDLWAQPRVAVFSSGTMEWQFFPKTNMLLFLNESAMEVTVLRGFVCWTHWRHILVLDMATVQFSLMDLPTNRKYGGTMLKLGETDDGKLCIVDIAEKTCVAWIWTVGDAGACQRWMNYKMFPLGPIVREVTKCSVEDEGRVQLKVVAVVDGFVYLSVFYNKDTECYRMLLSLCMKTADIKELLKDGFSYCNHAHPYIMAWPPSLVQNKEESENEATGDIVEDNAPVGMLEAPSSVLATALQSFNESSMNDDVENAAGMAAFVLPNEDEKSSLLRKINTLDAQFTTLRDRILTTSA